MRLEKSSADTAARRPRESVPARLVAHRPRPRRLLDFGCGQSVDVEYFQRLGIDAIGHDPHHRPLDLEPLAGAFDLVVCSYVLNTLPPEPRADALAQIRRLLCPGGRLVLSVRDRAQVEKERRPSWTAEADGWRTHRGTFQRGFGVHEVQALLTGAGFGRMLVLRVGHGITVEAVLGESSEPVESKA